ncbi:GT2 family glycosyltransferase [Roseiarcus fermentans]|uniref:GT2 family glycosyltransferase n=1 Tax=Roseiarcus fermentans TaxID=1473586 RepID=A0A366FHC1_9HYPH|nr:glycosyltransferase [Roseiarcus fermentans]RBP14073.1 GT2 family glycosyltransferase [Roseiarcus fermentans]
MKSLIANVLQRIGGNHALQERISLIGASEYFDPDWYLWRYPDVLRSGVDPLFHFSKHGDGEGRLPGPQFDSRAYAESWPDSAQSGMGPLEHFLRIGQTRGRPAPPIPAEELHRARLGKELLASGLFEAEWYRAYYPDLRDAEIDVFDHYLDYGAKEERRPGRQFSPLLYRIEYANEMAPDESCIEHYLLKGRAAGAKIFGESDYAAWIRLFDTLADEDLALIRADCASGGLPAIAVFHVLDAQACDDIEAIVTAHRGQLLTSQSTAFVFTRDIDEAVRTQTGAVLASLPNVLILSDSGGGASLPPTTAAYILIMHGAVRLAPHALYVFARAAKDESPEFAYSDHDLISDQGERAEPRFKPVFSPQYLKERFYTGPCVLARQSRVTPAKLAEIVDDLRKGRADALTEALLAPERRAVAHLPYPIYSLPIGARDLTRARSFAPRFDPALLPSVSIVILTRDRISLLRACIDSIQAKSTYPREKVQLVIVDNGSTTDEAANYFEELRSLPNVVVISDGADFNFARLCNFGARRATGDVLILLNNDTEVIDPGWIERLASPCLEADVGVVGAKLLYPDGAIQHAGCNVGVSGVAAHRLVGVRLEEAASTDVTRELSSVTGAALAVRRDVYQSVGGLDETLRVAFNDTTFCLNLLERGYRNLYIAEPLLVHHESKSRGYDTTDARRRWFFREAIYTRQSYSRAIRNDPYYSCNLSLQRTDDLAFPPRRTPPWRRSTAGRKKTVMFLSQVHAFGHGVPLVLKMQAERLVKDGFAVIVAGPEARNEFDYEGCRRIVAATPEIAAIVAVRENVDAIVVHTPPFYSVTRYLGERPLVYFVDHGEPCPDLFADRAAREDVNNEKRFCAALARRVFAISDTIRNQSLQPKVVVLRNANSHMPAWSDEWRERRETIREEMGWQNQFVILNCCRFTEGERRYKGLDSYTSVREELWFEHPDTQGRIVFALAGRAEEKDVTEMTEYGLSVFANVTDKSLHELYAAADLYMNFSKWEGYNLGIAQALAMGLPVVASDIEAHREFPIFVTNSIRVATEEVHRQYLDFSRLSASRSPQVWDWATPTMELSRLIRADLSEGQLAEAAESAEAAPSRLRSREG